MKKIIKILLLLVLVCIPNKVFAASIEVNCPSVVTVGDTLSCTVTGYHTSLAGLKAVVSYSGMNYISGSNLTGSNMFVVSSNELDGAFDIANTSKSLARYNFQANTVGTARINVTCHQIIDGTDFTSVTCTGASKTITIRDKEKEENTHSPVTPTPQATPPSSSNNPTAQKNTDVTLKEIKVNEKTIEFKGGIDNYDLEVDYNIEKVDIKGILNDKNATIDFEGDSSLKVGFNTIKLNVIAEDGITKKTYILNIVRKNKTPSANNKIKKLTINNYNINFKPSINEYDLTINNEDSLTMKVELEDETARYKIIGNKDLDNKSIIKIEVTAEDASTNIYTIKITKQENIIKFLSTGLIFSVIINIVVIVSSIIIIIKLNKKVKNTLIISGNTEKLDII